MYMTSLNNACEQELENTVNFPLGVGIKRSNEAIVIVNIILAFR